MADATGNYVSISIGAGLFAFYEHLMPGLRVEPGDRVKRGQVIGRLGSTGQASRPHLHFHLADADSPLGAEGLPYHLQGARTLGAYRSIAAFEAREPWQTGVTNSAGPTFPAPNAVVAFDRPS
jgi:murein DD-endopeptidase MepM/ murein hydrolase activator NlpD